MSNGKTDAKTKAPIEEQMRAIVYSLQTLADEQVKKKVSTEDRWLEDLQNYHGQYDADTLANLKASNSSQVFVNLTRSKTNAWEARLSDMLFPTDDKNWGVKPTPVPELAQAIQRGDDTAPDEHAVAETSSKAMEIEIEDQFRECRYNIKSRDIIRDSCVLGSGIMKGPLTSEKMKRKWVAPQEGGAFELTQVADPAPSMEWVDPWNYFPDMNARRKGEEEFEFERHLLNKKKMRQLAKRPGFYRDAIREILKEDAAEGLPSYVAQLKAITGSGETIDQRYHVWEYHGPISGEDLKLLCECHGENEMAKAYEDDPLEELNVIVWFCQGKILKFAEHPLDSAESMYSVFNLEKDDSSIFGYGVPYLMRNSQKVINSSWRMVLDNSGLSTGPQVVVNNQMIEPADGDWKLTPRKLWKAKNKSNIPMDHAFKVYHIDGRQEQLLRVIDVAKSFADEETNLPLVAQGESGSHQTQTSGGMSMLMNSVNVVFRRVVKNFDDDFTTPNIRRIYDWNMQFSPKEHIKGDYAVDARGSSVLLVREVQAQNLMQILVQFSAHPVLGPLTKAASGYRQMAQAHMLSADSLVKTDEELELEAKQAAENPPPPDPETMKIQAQMELSNMELEGKIALAEMDRETKLMALAAQNDMRLEDLRTKLGMHQIAIDSKERMEQHKTASKERIFAAEAGMKQKYGEGI